MAENDAVLPYRETWEERALRVSHAVKVGDVVRATYNPCAGHEDTVTDVYDDPECKTGRRMVLSCGVSLDASMHEGMWRNQ